MDGGSEAQGDWEPFGRPIFDDPASAGLDRVGVIDVGSNSVRLVVFDGAARSPAYFYNEKVMCGLGADMEATGRLNPEGKARAMAALKRFVALADGMALPPLTAVATAAVREAKDGPAFRAAVEAETGLVLHVINGAAEAKLAAQGVLLGWPKAEGMISDIGGSSMEVARVGAGKVRQCQSTPLGPLRLGALAGGKAARSREIDAVLAPVVAKIGRQRRLYLVGGSWRAIAKLDMARRKYPLTVIHDYRMTPEDVASTLDDLAERDLTAARKAAGLSSLRIALVPLAGEVLRRMMHAFGTEEIVVSAYGIREGLLYNRMPEIVRARDPLIEAARYAESTNARMPGFGRTLFRFIAPLFAESPVAGRLVKTACLLHDVSWRAHPDYRAEVCFDNATRGNLGGIDHPGRVFLGLALLHRYRNARPGHRFEPLLDLLSAEEIRWAEILGKAIRFGAMFALSDDSRMGTLHWEPEGDLTLTLPAAAAPLYGEVAEARFTSLAKALGTKPKVLGAEPTTTPHTS